MKWQTNNFVNGETWTLKMGGTFYSIFRGKAPWFTLNINSTVVDHFATFEDAKSIVELIAEKRFDLEAYRKKVEGQGGPQGE